MVSIAAVLMLGACGDDTSPTAPTDLAVPSLEDMSAPQDLVRGIYDFSIPSAGDAAGFCDGTPVAGTCLQPFFARAYACFAAAGCCVFIGNNRRTVEWQSGAGFEQDTTDGDYAHFSYDGNSCLFTNTDNLAWHWYAGLESIYYNIGTGDVTCPDGTQFNIGSNYGDCPALRAITTPPDYLDVCAPLASDAGAACPLPFPLQP